MPELPNRWLLMLAFLLAMALTPTPGHMHFSRASELASEVLPIGSILQASYRSMHWPLWTERVECGVPLGALTAYGPLYPPHIAALIALPIYYVYDLLYLSHALFGALGMLMLLRKFDVDLKFAALGGLLFALQNPLLAKIYGGHVSQFWGITYLPWLWYLGWTYVDHIEKRRIALGALFALAVGFLLLSGHYLYAFGNLAFTGLFLLVKCCSGHKKTFGRLTDLLVWGLLGIAIALPMWRQRRPGALFLVRVRMRGGPTPSTRLHRACFSDSSSPAGTASRARRAPLASSGSLHVMAVA